MRIEKSTFSWHSKTKRRKCRCRHSGGEELTALNMVGVKRRSGLGINEQFSTDISIRFHGGKKAVGGEAEIFRYERFSPGGRSTRTVMILCCSRCITYGNQGRSSFFAIGISIYIREL